MARQRILVMSSRSTRTALSSLSSPPRSRQTQVHLLPVPPSYFLPQYRYLELSKTPSESQCRTVYSAHLYTEVASQVWFRNDIGSITTLGYEQVLQGNAVDFAACAIWHQNTNDATEFPLRCNNTLHYLHPRTHVCSSIESTLVCVLQSVNMFSVPSRNTSARSWLGVQHRSFRSRIPISRSTAAFLGRPRRYTSTSTANELKKDAEEFPLPLPRALAPSKGLFLLSVPVAPEHWPSHLDLFSTLYRKSTKLLKQDGLAVNCVYDGHSQSTSFDVHTEETYPARLFSGDKRVIEYPSFSIDMVNQVKRDLEADSASPDKTHGVEVLVCTHGSRDCRCSDRGGALVSALRDELAKRGLEGRIKVSEVAHVGGHK